MANNVRLFKSRRNLKITQKQIIFLFLRVVAFRMIHKMSIFCKFRIFSNLKKWPKYDHLANIDQDIAKSIYFSGM